MKSLPCRLLPAPSRRAHLFDTDVPDAAKAVACPHVRECWSLPKLALRNARAVERITMTSWSGKDRQGSRAGQPVLQVFAGEVLRVDGCRQLRRRRLSGTGGGGIAIARLRHPDARKHGCGSAECNGSMQHGEPLGKAAQYTASQCDTATSSPARQRHGPDAGCGADPTPGCDYALLAPGRISRGNRVESLQRTFSRSRWPSPGNVRSVTSGRPYGVARMVRAGDG